MNFGGNGKIFFSYKFDDFNVKFSAPQREYGPPLTTQTPESEIQTELPQNFPPQPQIPNRETQSNTNVDQQRPVIAIANAEARGRSDSNVNVLATTSPQGKNGQYYILLPDSSLQKVRYATSQTEDDRTVNGFSAQLK